MTELPKHTNTEDRLYKSAGVLAVEAQGIWDEMGVVMDMDSLFDGFIYLTRDFGKPTSRQFYDEFVAVVTASGDTNSLKQRTVLIRMALARIGEVMRLADDGFRDEAWELLLSAKHVLSALLNSAAHENKIAEAATQIHRMAIEQANSIISERARNAAAKAHTANRAMRDEAHAWLDEHFAEDNLTIDRAAEELKKIVPVEFSTRKSYVKSWKLSR